MDALNLNTNYCQEDRRLIYGLGGLASMIGLAALAIRFGRSRQSLSVTSKHIRLDSFAYGSTGLLPVHTAELIDRCNTVMPAITDCRGLLDFITAECPKLSQAHALRLQVGELASAALRASDLDQARAALQSIQDLAARVDADIAALLDGLGRLSSKERMAFEKLCEAEQQFHALCQLQDVAKLRSFSSKEAATKWILQQSRNPVAVDYGRCQAILQTLDAKTIASYIDPSRPDRLSSLFYEHWAMARSAFWHGVGRPATAVHRYRGLVDLRAEVVRVAQAVSEIRGLNIK